MKGKTKFLLLVDEVVVQDYKGAGIAIREAKTPSDSGMRVRVMEEVTVGDTSDRREIYPEGGNHG